MSRCGMARWFNSKRERTRYIPCSGVGHVDAVLMARVMGSNCFSGWYTISMSHAMWMVRALDATPTLNLD